MDIRTTDHLLTIITEENREITARISKDEFYAIMYGIGRSLTFMIKDIMGDIYNICVEKTTALIDLPNKTMTLR